MAHRVAPQAEAELDNIWYYVAKESGTSRLLTGSLIRSPIDSIFLPVIRTSDGIATRIYVRGFGVFPWVSTSLSTASTRRTC
jgi:hypothetical protein